MSTRKTRQGKKKTETTTQNSTYNTRQKAVKRTPYRLAVNKSCPFTTDPGIDIAPYLLTQVASTSLDRKLHKHDKATVHTSHHKEHTKPDTKVPPPIPRNSPKKQPQIDQQIASRHVGQLPELGARLLSACKKIKPIFLVLISTVLATPVLVGIGWSKYSDNSVNSSIYQRYEKFSHDMLQLQKKYIHQSAWLWHGLRMTAWQALTEPLYTMPMALLMVIPHGHERVGFCIAKKAIDSFNKVHDQKSINQVICRNISQARSGNETAAHTREISIAIRKARQTHQSAVLIDHLENLANATIPILDKFLDPDDNQPENKMLIFTFYVPSAHCNPDFVRKFLVEAWISRVFARPTLAKKLIDNAVFITPYDISVKCK